MNAAEALAAADPEEGEPQTAPAAAAWLSSPTAQTKPRTWVDDWRDEVALGNYWQANGPHGEPGRWMGKGPEPPRYQYLTDPPTPAELEAWNA